MSVDAILSCKPLGGASSVPGTSAVPSDGNVATSTPTSSSASQPPATSTGQFLFVCDRT